MEGGQGDWKGCGGQVGILVRNKKRVKELAVSPRKEGGGRMKMEKPRLRTEDLPRSGEKDCLTNIVLVVLHFFWCTYLVQDGIAFDCKSKDQSLGRG